MVGLALLPIASDAPALGLLGVSRAIQRWPVAWPRNDSSLTPISGPNPRCDLACAAENEKRSKVIKFAKIKMS